MLEERALKGLKRGDPAALEWIMGRYEKYVATVIFNVLGPEGHRENVEELTADVFLSIWSHAKQLPSNKLKSYIGAMARNQAKSFLRKNRPQVMDLDFVTIPDPAQDVEQVLLEKERRRAVKQAIEQMRQPDREIFLRYYYYYQSTAEIAEDMNMDPGNVRVHLSRGRQRLKKALGEEDAE